MAEIFEPLRRRPVRPAWTGSPDRSPSAIPPIEVPQEIRDRVRSNGTPEPAEEAGVVITPPGSGGDLHGGSPAPGGPGSTPSDPPTAT